MRAAGLAWALACLALIVLALGASPGVFEGVSPLGLVLFPWLGLAGLPEAGRGRCFASLALGAPLLALGLRLELLDPTVLHRDALEVALAGVLVTALLAWSAVRAAAHPAHAALWCVLVPGLPSIWAACVWAAAPGGGAPGWLEELLALSPLAWCHASSRALAAGEALAVSPWPCVLSCSLLACVALKGRSEGPST